MRGNDRCISTLWGNTLFISLLLIFICHSQRKTKHVMMIRRWFRKTCINCHIFYWHFCVYFLGEFRRSFRPVYGPYVFPDGLLLRQPVSPVQHNMSFLLVAVVLLPLTGQCDLQLTTSLSFSWRAIIDHLMTHDKTTFRDLMSESSLSTKWSSSYAHLIALSLSSSWFFVCECCREELANILYMCSPSCRGSEQLSESFHQSRCRA